MHTPFLLQSSTNVNRQSSVGKTSGEISSGGGADDNSVIIHRVGSYGDNNLLCEVNRLYNCVHCFSYGGNNLY